MKMNRLYILSLFVSLAGTSLSQQVTSQEAIRAAINIMRNEQTAAAKGRGVDPLRYRPAEADRRTEVGEVKQNRL